MDSLWICISFIMVLGLSLEADAGCAENLKNDKTFQSCFLGYSMFISSEAQKMDPNDPSGMIKLMCSKTGKEKIKCVLTYIESCPDLMTTGDTATMFSSLASLKQMGGFEGMCSIISGNVPTGPCAAVTQCLDGQKTGGPSSPSPNGPTPFSVFQFYIGYMCGKMKGMFDCFKGTGDKCSHLMNDMKTKMDMERQNMGPGNTLPTFEVTKMFATQQCPKLPADFATNMCVKNSLNGDNFVGCFEKVSTNYPGESDKESCERYGAGHQCISKYVGKKCGNQYAKAIEDVIHLFMDIPTGCKLGSEQQDGPNDSSAHIHMSSISLLLVALLLTLKLK